MAAKLTKRQADNAKSAIQTGMLIKRLSEHVLEDKEMTASQVNAARILLAKSLPDLAKTEISGDNEDPLKVVFSISGLNHAGS